ncbi:M48 family metalloprotease [Aquabacterium sp.]|uniref:M48 family metalloprotease n=1 Tax=Aquabacterium sp. TaxID=1872578 RepID=UPI0025C4C51A|nr:M48 family metalloprotease [Aquabacterium sp.]
MALSPALPRLPRLLSGPRSLRWRLICLTLACWPLGQAVQAQETGTGYTPVNQNVLPALGDAAAQDLSPSAERKLGDRIMRSLRRDPDVVDDPLVLEYVDHVWRALLAAAHTRGEIGPELDATHAWEPFLVRDRSVNAFALPGGYIGVHFGLLAMTTSPDELASVLAHELSHVTQRHIARMISQQSRQSWVSIASMVVGILAAARAPQAAQAMIYGGQAVAIQNQLNFSRDMEREADRVGFGLLGEAGFEPGGMALMFEHLQQASRLNDDGSFPYLRTHPLTTERIGEARARIGPTGWDLALQGGHPQSALWAWHTLMSARSKVLMDTRSIALQSLLNPEIKPGTPPLEALSRLYAATLAAQRGGAPGQAMTSLAQARLLVARLPQVQQAVATRVLAQAEVEGRLLDHQPGAAAEALRRWQASPLSADSATARPELLAAAQVAQALGDTDANKATRLDIANRLQTHLSLHPNDATAWAALSSLWQGLGQPLRSVRADAESVAALGDLPGAIDRIQGAQKRFRQPDAAEVIELSVMASRVKAWQRQQREDMQEGG